MLRVIALLGIVFVCQSLADSECPDGWIFHPDTSECYFFSPNLMTFDEAVPYCQSIGGKLASIGSYNEQYVFTGMTNTSVFQPWIGARRNTTTGTFYNIDKSYFYTYMWTTNEPSTNGDCVSYKGVGVKPGLQVTPCYQMQPAFCKQTPALCNGGVFGGSTVRSGSIQSPGFPVQYYNNLRCYYYINAPNGTYITIDFSVFLVEEWHDYVDVYDGNTTTYANYIGSPSNSWIKDTTFESTSNQMLVVFYTDYAITDKGWNATWSVQRIMPPIRQSGNNGTLTSPNYPSNYDAYDEQLYYISAPYGVQINMTIDDFRTESKYDYLNIYNSTLQNNNTLVATLSGSIVTPWNYVSTSNYLSMKFISDGYLQYKGWHLSWNIC